MIPDFEVLDSKIATALKKLLTADFKRRVHMEEQKEPVLERKTNCLHDVCDNFKISGTSEALF